VKPKPQPDPQDKDWRNLRDQSGRLYGRVNRVQMLLEIRQHNRTMVIDLKTVLEIKPLDRREDLE